MRRMRCLSLILAVCILVAGVPTTRAESIPFVTNAPPQGFAWWCNGGCCLLLPAEAKRGPQLKIFLVVPGDQADAMLIAWMGGGEVIWQGGLKAGGLDWQARLAKGNGRRGLIGVSQGGGWTFVVASQEASWRQDAAAYNSVLRGGSK